MSQPPFYFLQFYWSVALIMLQSAVQVLYPFFLSLNTFMR